MIPKVWVILGLTFSLENGSHFPGAFGVGVCQVILDVSWTFCVHFRSCYIILWRTLSFVFVLNRQSPWLGSDCKLCLAFRGWWFQCQFNFQNLCCASLTALHMCHPEVSLSWQWLKSYLSLCCTALGLRLRHARGCTRCHGLPVSSSSLSSSLWFLAFRALVHWASDEKMGFLSGFHLLASLPPCSSVNRDCLGAKPDRKEMGESPKMPHPRSLDLGASLLGSSERGCFC